MSNHSGDTRERLLQAAGEVFGEKGFDAATIREICARAGANLAAVHYYFGDKRQLYLAAVTHVHRHAPWKALEWPEGTAAQAKLRDYVCLALKRIMDPSRPPWHARLMLREMLEPTGACAELVEADIRPRIEVLTRLVEELVPIAIPTATRNLIAFSIIGQCLFHHFNRWLVRQLVGEEEYQTYDVERLADHITRFSLAALAHYTEGNPGRQNG